MRERRRRRKTHQRFASHPHFSSDAEAQPTNQRAAAATADDDGGGVVVERQYRHPGGLRFISRLGV